jgi:hypothetical protein
MDAIPSRLARALALVAIAVSGLTAAAVAAPPAQAQESLWLCRPGLAVNPCLSDQTATVELGNGFSFLQRARPAARPPIDCFYIYPTVSSQPTENAPVAIEPEEEAIAVAQASRFSQACAVYAPIYPQLTIPAISRPGGVTPEGVLKAYGGVVGAFEEYLARYNHGRGFVLIGHSQGAAMLIQLIRERIDPDPSLRRRLVSAILLGGNVIVPEGKALGGSFQHVPACRLAWQTHCVIAYSSFLRTPPDPSFFGRPESPLLALGGGAPGVASPQVLCVNPAVLVQGGGEGPLFSYYPTSLFPGLLGAVTQVPSAPTPWVGTPGEYDAQCRHEGGASWLELRFAGPPRDPRQRLEERLGPQWGTHLADVNVALGNLVALVRVEGFVYRLEQGF